MSIPFAAVAIDRASARRTDGDWLEAHAGAGEAYSLADGSVTPVAGREVLALLGVRDDGSPLWLLPGRAGPELRAAAMAADASGQSLMAYAAHLSWFHHTHRFCGRCGTATHAREAGFVRRCENDHDVHPRIDPVVIMLVEDGTERVLLGRQASWPAGRYSALAGFVEPGESLEAAVAREVMEEAGVQVAGARYMASQPWPFPGSLMLGFHVDYTGGEAGVHDEELEDVRWFSREEVAAAAEHDAAWEETSGALMIPPKLAIARHLLDDWLASG